MLPLLPFMGFMFNLHFLWLDGGGSVLLFKRLPDYETFVSGMEVNETGFAQRFLYPEKF